MVDITKNMLESYKPRWNESKEEKLGRYKRIQQEIQDFQQVVDQGQSKPRS